LTSDVLSTREESLSNTLLRPVEAIVGRRLVDARYNDLFIRLAPHQLFERPGDLFLSALNLRKWWRSSDEQRLGQFKLLGLSNVELLSEKFEPLPSYDANAPQVDVVVSAV
jgi:hypothetical protein